MIKIYQIVTVMLYIRFFLVLFATGSVFAYIDPGSGSYIISLIILGFVTFYGWIKGVLIKIKDFFTKKDK